jgi:hypothetical protein
MNYVVIAIALPRQYPLQSWGQSSFEELIYLCFKLAKPASIPRFNRSFD